MITSALLSAAGDANQVALAMEYTAYVAIWEPFGKGMKDHRQP